MTDDKLIVDEAQRAANYEVLKSKVESDVRSDIAAKAERRPTAGTTQLAEDMNSRAVDEVAETRSEIDRGRVAARISQVVDYVFFVIYGLLAVRLILELFAAREGVAFFRLIAALTDPIYWPFKGLVPSLSVPDGFSLELPIIVALFVYALLHMAINGILRMMAHRKVAI
jgi:uncharacterized protein YggT (Ycf19 family)